MNALIDYYDNVIMKTDWTGKTKGDTEAIVKKCRELANAASNEDFAECRAHIKSKIADKKND